MARLLDTSYVGGVTHQGNLATVENIAALKNALIMWLLSYPSDALKHAGRGGKLIPFIGKPLTTENRDSIYIALKDGFASDFPQVQLLDLQVRPDYEARAWVIAVVAYSAILKGITQTTVRVRAE